MKLLLPPDLEPKIATVLREGYSLADLRRDALAGVVVGIVALPLAIAFAIASGVRPEQGLYTAIVGGFLISALGGSRVQIGGPTGAFVVLVAGVVAEFGYEGLVVATIMAGGILVAMALARLGDAIRFIPYPVVVGFTSGIALIIALGQLGDAFGLDAAALPADTLGRLSAFAHAWPSARGGAVLLFVITIAIIQLWPRVSQRVPGPLVALVATTALAHGAGLDVETIRSRFGDIPTSLPSFQWPRIPVEQLPALVSPAVSIALLGAIESLLSAMVADGLTGGRHRSNAELLGQGVANIVTPLFGGIPATGAIARTATNVRNGGRSPVAGMVHALTLVAILLVAVRWASLIPMATLSGILIVVAYNMSEWRAFLRLFRGPRSDVGVLLATFVLTVAVDLAVAIQVGVVLASLLFMRRMSEVSELAPVRDVARAEIEDLESMRADLGTLPDAVAVFEINGSFCFGAARKFSDQLLKVQGAPKVVILRMRHVLAMDATGLEALEDVAARFERRGVTLLLSGVQAQPRSVLERSGALGRIGEGHVFGSFAEAARAARLRVDAPSG